MLNLNSKIINMKSNLEARSLKGIRNTKFKTISTKEISNVDIQTLNEYNYYAKLTKRVRKYINTNDDIIFDISRDKNNRIICLLIKFNKYNMEIFMPIDIRIITGDTKDSFMDCTYYNLESEGKLYIKEFLSGKPNNGYGKIILKNLDNIIFRINLSLDNYNHYSTDYKFNYINKIEGIAIPTKTIISQVQLNRIYRKYGFEVDEENNMSIFKKIEINI
ncbi:MAG: hypothetical protein ACRCXT_18445 [Paraclostridium sp.]